MREHLRVQRRQRRLLTQGSELSENNSPQTRLAVLAVRATLSGGSRNDHQIALNSHWKPLYQKEKEGRKRKVLEDV
jgi:hypothetical protein